MRTRVLTSDEAAGVLSLRDHVASVSIDFGLKVSSFANVLKPALLFVSTSAECSSCGALEGVSTVP